MDLREPDHLVVVGGGYVGCDFAQMFARFGARVTVVQRGERLLPGEDPDISAAVEQAFTDELVASHLLIATGRTADSDELGLEYLTSQPTTAASSRSTTRCTPEDVWVLGDLRGGAMFTHTARDDADRVTDGVQRPGPLDRRTGRAACGLLRPGGGLRRPHRAAPRRRRNR